MPLLGLSASERSALHLGPHRGHRDARDRGRASLVRIEGRQRPHGAARVLPDLRTQLFSESTASAGRMRGIRSASLEDATWFAPQVEIFTRSAQPWDGVARCGPQRRDHGVVTAEEGRHLACIANVSLDHLEVRVPTVARGTPAAGATDGSATSAPGSVARDPRRASRHRRTDDRAGAADVVLLPLAPADGSDELDLRGAGPGRGLALLRVSAQPRDCLMLAAAALAMAV
jgi:hypothetical protein